MRKKINKLTIPFTSFHVGFGILLFARLSFLDQKALFLGTIIIDLEPIFHLLFDEGQLHGVMHSLLEVIIWEFILL